MIAAKPFLISLSLWYCLGGFSLAYATPYEAADDEVLLHVPDNIVHAVNQTTLPAERLAQAQAYFDQGRLNSDPRAIGSAQLLLQSWQNNTDVPAEVLLLRAKIAQYRHQFAAARKDLQHILNSNQQHTEAWLILAFVERVQGNYSSAQRACTAASKQSAVAGTLCRASVLALQGELQPAYQQLAKLQHVEATTQQWRQTEMAIIQSRLGNPKQAQRHFQRALLIAQHDPYLLAAYADFLLSHEKAETAYQLLTPYTQDDSLLLRAALAAQRIKAPEAAQWQHVLRARFDTAVLRQETLHQRESARFALFAEHKPQQALRLAKANWQVQKEPEDALLFLQAAQSAGHAEAAISARYWAEKYNWVDVLAGASICAHC